MTTCARGGVKPLVGGRRVDHVWQRGLLMTIAGTGGIPALVEARSATGSGRSAERGARFGCVEWLLGGAVLVVDK